MRHNHTDGVEHENVIRQFEEIWRARAGDAAAPAVQAIGANEIAKIMPHLMLLEVEPVGNASTFRTRLVGAAHKTVCAEIQPGDLLDHVDHDHAERLRVAASTGQPVYWRDADDGSVSIGDFPFSTDGQTVDRIVSVVAGAAPRRSFFG